MRRCVIKDGGVYLITNTDQLPKSQGGEEPCANAPLGSRQEPTWRFSVVYGEQARLSHSKLTRKKMPTMNGFLNSGRPLTPDPQISLHSFVFGFVVGCVVVCVLHTAICGREGCSYDQRQVLVQVEAFPSSVPFTKTKVESRLEGDYSKETVGNGRADVSIGLSIDGRLTQGKQRTRDERKKFEAGVVEREDNAGERDGAVVGKFHNVSSLSGCPSRQLHLVILVLSAPGGVIRRNAIRGTWLHNYHSGMLKVTSRFLIGTNRLLKEKMGNLTVEQNQFGDLLFFDELRDSYSNLSAKVLLGLKWVYKTVKFDFLIKTDDDSYVRIDQVAKNIQQMDCNDRLYWGYFMGHALPEPSGKWAEYNWFNCPHYLPYAMGGGYVLSNSVLSMIMRFSHRLKLYNNEDVTIGSWLAPFNLFRKHDIRFDVESLSHGCNNHYIITHKERVRSLYEKYTNLLKNGTICEVEKEIRPAYVYNWSAAPIDCCLRTKGLLITDQG